MLLSLLYIFALWASVQASNTTGLHISFAAVAVVFLTGQAAGSVIPTPGGVGGVEVGADRAADDAGADRACRCRWPRPPSCCSGC